MNIHQITLILTQTSVTPEGKTTKTSRRFTQLKPTATREELKAFSNAIQALTGEQYDAIEVLTSEYIQ
ncbi:hypothetical protein RN70_10920 [Staphylococcus schleiferi]|uniref:DUF1659 domain-containing protein n=1 Tax=Staphylococcus coagulans TaxID=74706 RepID=A0ABU1EYJ2_9STAP|nr:hypothetical protein [Staphylococcus coagulans]AKS67803.1 hypothetical protein LH95_10185 [Staphylococcus schleiferi]AKS69970.1 hypothetical protein NP71_10645 [Staphylococcus schleiferi]AKS72088.1 hypothetical protein OA96_09910 [Staphylococcus schleiferi]AKS74375.1 hypothetical protein RN70_10920 [Staphylococcus schleiferi]MBA8759693.1 DUF1659 domain-containing protein [Staphylococcus coagulans]